MLLTIVLISLFHPSLSFSYAKLRLIIPSSLTSSRLLLLHEQIDRQSDKTKYGRGIDHISADINEKDVIAYQVGTWYVDGTEVGNGSPSTIRYCLVDAVQIVWTHDCEHGLVYGFDLTVADTNDEPVSCDGPGAMIKKGNVFIIEDEYVQCGPEQILCKIPVVQGVHTKQAYVSIANFNPVDEMITT